MLVFVYGTLISGFHNNRFLSRPEPRGAVKPAKFVGAGTTVGKFLMRDVGFPYIKHAPRGKQAAPVRGEVWDIGAIGRDNNAAALLAGMDRLEGFNPEPDARHNHYTRMEFAVLVDGESEPRTCMLYHPTDTTWERAAYAADVKPNKKGLLSWAELNATRRARDV